MSIFIKFSKTANMSDFDQNFQRLSFWNVISPYNTSLFSPYRRLDPSYKDSISNLETGCYNGFSWFFLCLPPKLLNFAQIRPRLLPSITFPVHFRRFHKLRKTTIKIVMAVSPSVHLSAQKNPPPARRM